MLQSDTCGMRIPNLDFELTHGTLGGRFTTLEGLLNNVRDQVKMQTTVPVFLISCHS